MNLDAGFRLGPWLVEPKRNIISAHQEERHLENRMMQTLVFLARHPGEVLTREAFFESVWQGRVVNEEALSRSISLLRSALGDSAASPSFIQTIPGVGYRLIAEVVPLTVPRKDAQGVQPPRPAPDTETASLPEPRRLRHRGLRWLGLALGAALLVFAVARFLPNQEATSGNAAATGEAAPNGPTPMDRSLAVLPFVNLSTEAADDAFADGMTEELLTRLGRVPSLRVTARTSSFFFKNRDVPIGDIAETLNVAHVVEGSVRRQGPRVRVTAQLIDARSAAVLWSETYERETEDLFAIQDDVSEAIAGALATSLNDEAQVASRSDNLAAYEAYRSGRLLWWQRSPGELRQAIALFEDAIAADPGFAPAYAAIADSWLLLVLYGDVHIMKGQELAEPMLAKAFELDPDCAEAHAALGLERLVFGRKIEAETHLRRAIALDEGYIPAYLWISALLSDLGRVPEQGLMLRRAMAMDPLNPMLVSDYGRNLQVRGDNDSAVDTLQALLRLQPEHATLLASLSEVLLRSGRLIESWEAASKAFAIQPDNIVVIKAMAAAWMAVEAYPEAEAVLLAGLEHSGRSVELKMQYLDLLIIQSRAEDADAVMLGLFPRDITILGIEQQRTFHYYRGLIDAQKEDFLSMRDHFQQVIHPVESHLYDHHQIFLLTAMSLVNTATGDTDTAEEQLATAERVIGHARVNGIDDAEFYFNTTGVLAVRGETDLALHTLEQAYERGFRANWLLQKDGRLQNLRGDPAFDELQRRITADIDAARARINERRISYRVAPGDADAAREPCAVLAC